MKSETWQQLDRRFINKTYDAITATGLGPEPFRKVIWWSGSSRIKLMHTSYPHLGKGPLWSPRTWTMDHTTLSIFESTNTHVSQRRRPAGHGILLIFGLTTLEPPALWCTYFDNVYIIINKAGIPDKAGLLPFYLQRIMSFFFVIIKRVTWGLHVQT